MERTLSLAICPRTVQWRDQGVARGSGDPPYQERRFTLRARSAINFPDLRALLSMELSAQVGRRSSARAAVDGRSTLPTAPDRLFQDRS